MSLLSSSVRVCIFMRLQAVMGQRRYDMRHEMLTQRARFCIGVMAKKGTLSQHFLTHVVPPLVMGWSRSEWAGL